MKKNKILAIHIACLLIYLIYIYIGQVVHETPAPTSYFSYTIFVAHFAEFYVCYLWVFPNFLKRGMFFQLIAGLGIAMAVFIALRYLLEQVVILHFFGFQNYTPDTTAFYYIIDNLYYGSSYIVLGAFAWSVQNAFSSHKVNKQLKDEAIKAELSFLKSQINPHFLYNTLNYIYSLAIPVSDQLAAAVLRLSDLMRYTLTESADGKVSLVKEVEYLHSYIELFRMRFDPDFYVEFEQIGITDQQRIASLLLIPFIENAFKHGVVNQPEHPVQIHLEVRDKELYFMVSNTINNHQKDKSSGIGLINIQRRLGLIYPDRHELDISRNENTYRTALTIQL